MANIRSCLSALGWAVLTCTSIHGQSSAPVARFEYDPEGNLKRSVAAPHSLALSDELRYDSLSRVIQHLDPSRGATDFAYLGGQSGLRSVTDPRRLMTSYGLDGLNQRRSIASPDRGAETQSFDAAGNALGGDNARYLRSVHSYDALNRLTSIQFQQPQFLLEPMPANMAYSTVATHRFLYDQIGPDHGHGVGRLTTQSTPASETRYAYDAQGRMTRIRQAVSHLGRSHVAILEFRYDNAGNVIGVTYPSGRSLVLTREGGLPSQMSMSLLPGGPQVPVVESLEWAAGSRLGDGAQWRAWTWSATAKRHERQFDEWGRLARLPLGPWQRQMQYDDADRVIAYTHSDAADQALPMLDQRFIYDANSRLSFASNGVKEWTYGYDTNGNRIASNSAAGPRSFNIYADSNRLNSATNPTASWAHDAQGNVRGAAPWAGQYDAAGQLSRIDVGASSTQYLYDAARRRVLKGIADGVATVFVHGLRGELLGEYDLQSGAAIREYLWLEDTPVALVGQSAGAPSAEVFAIHADRLDTPRVVTDSLGRLRWTWLAEPFGNEAANHQPTAGLGAINLPLRMPGQYWDAESGFFYNHHRYYDPRAGRYLQSDPIGLAGGINTYSYVGGNPVSNVDPTGELWLLGASVGAGFELALQALKNYRNGCALLDTGNYNWGQVGVAIVVGAVAPGWLAVGKTSASSGRALANLGEQLGRAQTANRAAKVESRIVGHAKSIADVVIPQLGFQGVKAAANQVAGSGGNDCNCKK